MSKAVVITVLYQDKLDEEILTIMQDVHATGAGVVGVATRFATRAEEDEVRALDSAF